MVVSSGVEAATCRLSNSFILDGFEWSFSRINAYKTCPRMFRLTYIDCIRTTDNAFAEWGTLGHSLFERYFKGEKQFYELSALYEKEYPTAVTHLFPPNAYVDLNQKYHDVGKEYFDNFEGLYEDAERLGIEEEIHIKIGEYRFVGYIDLILRDERGIFIVDHKSKSKFKNKKEKEEYLIQLYLYSLYIFEKYGEWPYRLVFNMFRANEIIDVDFDMASLEAAKKWVTDTISEIYEDIEFNTKADSFFCDFLCSVKECCPCSAKYLEE